jgi:hypothetical protein
MKLRAAAFVTTTIVGIGLAAGGCTTSPTASPAPGRSGPVASPTASAPSAKAELVAALRRTQRAPHRYAVRGDLPDKQRVRATGAFDAKARRISYTLQESGGKNPQALQRIVIAKDEYTRESKRDRWVHLNLRRVKKGGIHDFDMTDPTGLTHFAATIRSVDRIDPHTYRGTYDPFEGSGEFLPIGVPSIITFGQGGADDFTVRTDAKGWVTSIETVLTTKKATMRMKTTLSAHGKRSAITRPRSFGEAMDFYYDR